MPYTKKTDAPANWQVIDGKKLTLEQINHLSSIYDALLEDGRTKESASKIAVAQFKRLYKKTETGWTRLEVEKTNGVEINFSGQICDLEKIEMGVYKKEILRTGNYAHPQYPNAPFDVTVERIKKWITNFKNKIVDFVPVPISGEKGHRNADDPKLNKGEVLDVWQEGNMEGGISFFGKIKIDDETSVLIDQGKLRGVSASISPNYLDKFGKNVGEVFTHLLLTNIPYITGTAPFQPIMNSTNEIIGSMINLNREGKPDMELTAVPFKKYPLITEGAWSGSEAELRIRKKYSSDESGDKDTVDFDKYKEGFAWYNSEDRENFGSYKLPHHDIEEGQLKTHRGGVIGASNALAGARGGVNIPAGDLSAVRSHINKHRQEFDLEPLEFEGSQDEIDMVKKELSDYKEGTGNPDPDIKNKKKTAEVIEMDKVKELEIQLEKERTEKADLAKQKTDLEREKGDLEKKNQDIETERERLNDLNLESQRKEDTAQVEIWLEEGKITEAHKPVIEALLESGRTIEIEMEVAGKKEKKDSRALIAEFVSSLPKAIDYEVVGKGADGKPGEGDDKKLEEAGERAGKKAKGEDVDKK